jgi:putative oxidoreductase
MDSLFKILSPLGKWFYSIPIFLFGVFHFMGANDMAGMVPAYLPGGVIWVYLTGVALVAAAVSVFIGKMTRTALLLLGIMLMLFALMIHLPGVMSGENQMAMPSLLKDMAMAGGAWILASRYDS